MEAIADLKMTVDKLSQQYEQTQTELAVQASSAAHQQSYITSLQQQVASAEAQRRALHNTIQELKGSIRVMCRVRPAPAGSNQILQLPAANRLSVRQGGEDHAWSFDKVFSTTSKQEEVFE